MTPTSVVRAAALLAVYAGFAGAAGVAMAAASAHGAGWRALASPAQLLMMHAAASLAIAAVAMRAQRPSGFLLAGLLLLLGVTLFSGDITARTLWDGRLFPMAAPIGGSTMIAGWLVVSAAGLLELATRRG